MTTKKPEKAADEKPANDPNMLRADRGGASPEAASARLAYDPAVRSLRVAREFVKGGIGGEQPLTESLDALVTQIKEVQNGSLVGVERTLVSQASTLDAIFNELALRAAMNVGQYAGATETYLRLAFKAQSQCRTTLETLAEIKNPRQVAFVRQANIAHGPQQVNNQTSESGVCGDVRAPTHAGENKNQSNELLEVKPHERLDSGTASTAGGTDTQVEAVGAVNGAAK